MYRYPNDLISLFDPCLPPPPSLRLPPETTTTTPAYISRLLPSGGKYASGKQEWDYIVLLITRIWEMDQDEKVARNRKSQKSKAMTSLVEADKAVKAAEGKGPEAIATAAANKAKAVSSAEAGPSTPAQKDMPEHWTPPLLYTWLQFGPLGAKRNQDNAICLASSNNSKGGKGKVWDDDDDVPDKGTGGLGSPAAVAGIADNGQFSRRELLKKKREAKREAKHGTRTTKVETLLEESGGSIKSLVNVMSSALAASSGRTDSSSSITSTAHGSSTILKELEEMHTEDGHDIEAKDARKRRYAVLEAAQAQLLRKMPSIPRGDGDDMSGGGTKTDIVDVSQGPGTAGNPVLADSSTTGGGDMESEGGDSDDDDLGGIISSTKDQVICCVVYYICLLFSRTYGAYFGWSLY